MKRFILFILILLFAADGYSAVTIKLRGDTSANWTANNPVLAIREPGVETDTGKMKIGDGATSWTGLGYVAGGSVDLTEPGPIGSVTPNTGAFTTLVADDINVGSPPSGETGEIGLPEDPDNGTNEVILKAPFALTADRTIDASRITEQVDAPASATDTCSVGQEAVDASYIYKCVAANTWIRVAGSTW
jgi:hypothetical protein